MLLPLCLKTKCSIIQCIHVGMEIYVKSGFSQLLIYMEVKSEHAIITIYQKPESVYHSMILTVKP